MCMNSNERHINIGKDECQGGGLSGSDKAMGGALCISLLNRANSEATSLLFDVSIVGGLKQTRNSLGSVTCLLGLLVALVYFGH